MTQRLIRHDRTQVRAAKADVDDVANAFAGMPEPLAAADPIGECGHPVEHRVHPGYDVDAVDADALALWCAQCNVEHRTLLRHVDLLAAEHCVDARAQAALFGKIPQQSKRLVGDAILGVIEVKSGGFGIESLAAPGIVGEKLPQVPTSHRFVMRLERFPRSALRQHGRPHFRRFHRQPPKLSRAHRV